MYRDTNGVMRAKRELVVPRNADKERIEPTEGFAVGEQIVVAGHSGLKDDAPVRELKEDRVTSLAAMAAVSTNSTTVSAAKGKATSSGN
jgi:hypothetical protein